jgi:hypothetical protein
MITMRTIVPKPINMGTPLVSAGLKTVSQVGGRGASRGQDGALWGPVVRRDLRVPA